MTFPEALNQLEGSERCLWANDYTEWGLWPNEFGAVDFYCHNVELVHIEVYHIPVTSESDFVNLMKILEK